jgi:hypothetical protein
VSTTRRVVLESSQKRTVADVPADSVAAEKLVAAWLMAAVKASRDGGRCVSFTVSVHCVDENCDHETEAP